MEKAICCRRNWWVRGQAWAPTHCQTPGSQPAASLPTLSRAALRSSLFSWAAFSAGIRNHQPEEFQKRGHCLCHLMGFPEVTAPGWLIRWLPSPGGTLSTPAQLPPPLIGHIGCPGPALMSRRDGEWWSPVQKGPLHIASHAFMNLLIYYQQGQPLPEAEASFPIQLPSLHRLKPHARRQACLGQEKGAHPSWGWDWELPGAGAGALWVPGSALSSFRS